MPEIIIKQAPDSISILPGGVDQAGVIAVNASWQLEDCYKAEKTQLEILQEKFARKEQTDEYANNLIKRSQTYMRIGRAIHNEWFPRLPRKVQEELKTARIFNLPRLFTIWWLYRSCHMPNQFTLPHVFANFQKYSIYDEDGDDLTPLLFEDNGETELGRIVATAWDFMPPVDQDLMVYCWAAQQEGRAVRGGLAFPRTSVAEAKVFLMRDMGDGSRSLHIRAIAVVQHSRWFANSE